MISALYYTALRGLGIPAAVRRSRDAAVILCYHNVVPADLPRDQDSPSLHISEPRFRGQMRWLAEHYRVVPLRELLERRRNGAPLRATAAITFDDAYTGVFEYARPVLNELDLPATVFVVTEAPGAYAAFWWDHPAARAQASRNRARWLTDLHGDRRAILRDLGAAEPADTPHPLRPADWSTITAAVRSGRIDLGVHSATHRALPGLPARELADEVVGARDTLARRAGLVPQVFTYPYGLWDDTVRRAVQDAGYAAGLTLDFGLVSSRSDPWALPRINVPDTIGRAAFQAWSAGLGPPRRDRT